MDNKLHIIGDLASPTGLAEAARAMVKAIEAVGLHYTIHPLDESGKDVAKNPNRSKNNDSSKGEDVINLIFFNLHLFHSLDGVRFQELTGGRYTIAVWFFELNQLPPAWLAHLDLVDEIWVATEFVRSIFNHAGTAPVLLVPPPVLKPSCAEIGRSFFNIPNDRPLVHFSFSAQSGFGRKNPMSVVEAFSLAFGSLDKEDRPLLLIKVRHGEEFPELLEELRHSVEDVGGILWTKELERDENLALLACSDMYVSLHRAEGLGLGMMEAMMLGVPVVATNYSGNVDFLDHRTGYPIDSQLRPISEHDHCGQEGFERVYPLGFTWAEPDINIAAQAMRMILDQPEDAAQRAHRAERRMAEMYSLESVGEKIVERIHQILQRGLHHQRLACRYWRNVSHGTSFGPNWSTLPLKIAFWTPLPPEPSGISEYSVELLECLSNHLDITVIHRDGLIPTLHADNSIKTVPRSEMSHPESFDLHIYQMGNSPYHDFMLENMKHWPGLCVLHDLTMGHLFFHLYTQGHMSLEELLREVEVSEGPRPALRLGQLLENPLTKAEDLYNFFSLYPMVQYFVKNSLMQVVHLPHVVDILPQYAPQCQPALFLQGCRDPYKEKPPKVDEIRRRFSLPENEVIWGCFGSIQRGKRVTDLLEPLKELREEGLLIHLLIVGRGDPEVVDELKKSSEERCIQQYITCLESVNMEDFLDLMIACDIGVNLRFPSQKQMSGVLVRWMATGRPIVMTELPEWNFLPGAFAFRVPHGDECSLKNVLKTLSEDSTLRQESGRRAREYYESHGAMNIRAREMEQLIREGVSMHRAQFFYRDAPRVLNHLFSGKSPGMGWRDSEVTEEGLYYQWTIEPNATLTFLLDRSVPLLFKYTLLKTSLTNSEGEGHICKVDGVVVEIKATETPSSIIYEGSLIPSKDGKECTEFLFEVNDFPEEAPLLGLCFCDFKVWEPLASQPQQKSHSLHGGITPKPETEILFGEGWGDQEITDDGHSFRWMTSMGADMELLENRGRILSWRRMAEAEQGLSSLLEVRAEGQILPMTSFELGAERFSAILLLRDNFGGTLHWSLPKVRSAHDMGYPEDGRKLGLAIGELNLHEWSSSGQESPENWLTDVARLLIRVHRLEESVAAQLKL